MLVTLVDVATGGVRLPDLDELVAQRPAPRVEQPALDRHALTLRLTRVLQREVALDERDIALAEGGRPQLDGLGIDEPGVLGRMAQDARAVRREVVERRGHALSRSEAGLGIRVQVLDLLRDLSLGRHVGRGEQGLGCGGGLLEHDRG
jgi:hypothetical protein